MVAVIDAQQLVPLRPVVFHELHARRFKLIEFLLLQLRASQRVHDHVDLHARPRSLRERRHEPGAEFPRAKNEILQRDRALRLRDRRQHCRENFVPVHERGDFVSWQQRRAHQVPDRFPKGGVLDRIGRGNLLVDWFVDPPRDEDDDEKNRARQPETLDHSTPLPLPFAHCHSSPGAGER
jgi:hypothetical protein